MNTFYEFESFRIDEEKRLLWKDEKSLSVKPKTFDTLLVLLKHKNEIISKDDLVTEIWNGNAVSDDSLTQQISQLRKLLGDDANEHRFIVTVPGIGYKFVAKVNILNQNGQTENFIKNRLADNRVDEHLENRANFVAENRKEKIGQNGVWLTKFKAVSGVFLFLALTASLFYYFGAFRQEKPPKSILEIKRIAVLPFQTVSNDEQMISLKSGLKSELITRLSKFENLSLLSTAAVSGYETSGKDAVSFGKQLNVEAVLDGNIRKSGNSISVTAQLIRTSDGEVLWSELFTNDLTDIIETQLLVAYKISETLSLELVDNAERRKMKRATNSAEAYRLFLDAKYIIYSRKGGEARELAKKNLNTAINLDPNFALAYVFLGGMEADAPSVEGYQRMKILTKKAIELDGNLQEAHSNYALAIWRGDWNWTEAQKHLDIANRLDPSYAEKQMVTTLIFIGQGKFREAHEYISSRPKKDAIALPDELALYYYERNYDKAIELSLERQKKMPGDAESLSYLALAYTAKGLETEAMEMSKEYASFDELTGIGGLVYLGYASAKFGYKKQAGEIINKITSKSLLPTAQIHGGLAMIYGELGEKDKAFEHLEKSIENREWWAFTLKVAPYYDSLRSDKRFGEMVRRVNLAE